jgi:peptidoglycan/xylan/chitin deacetylase (PgdA/CDA1 family)
MYGIKDFAKTTLNEALDSSETGIDVVDAGKFSSIFSTISSIRSFVLTIWSSTYNKPSEDSGMEKVLVINISSNTLTVIRGWDGTTPSTHSSGDNIALFLNASNIQQILDILPFGEYGAIVGKSRPTRTPLVTFWFDDGASTDYTILRPLFAAQGEVGAISIVTDIADGGAALTWTQAHTMEDEGWEITNHSKSHNHLTSYTEAQLESDIQDSITAFRNQGFDPKVYAYPYNAHNELVRRIMRKYFYAARANSDVVNPVTLEHYNLLSYDIDSFNLTEIYELIDEAQRTNRWLIFYGHSGGYDAGDQTSLNTVIDYIQAAGIPIVTPTEGLDIMGNTLESGDGLGVSDVSTRLNAQVAVPLFDNDGGAGTVNANIAVGAGNSIELGTATTALMTFTRGLQLGLSGGTIMFEFTPSNAAVDPTFLRDGSTGWYIRWRGSLNTIYFYQDASHLATFTGTGYFVNGKKTHVAFTIGSNHKVKCYLNGDYIGENATVFTVAPIWTELRNYLATTSILINNLRVWDTIELTQEEIWQEMYSEYAVKTSGLERQLKGQYFTGTYGSPAKFANVKQYDLILP